MQVILPDIEPYIFQLVSDWLHTNRLTADSDNELHLDHLIDVYLFADLIGSHTLKNYTMDLIQDNMYRHVRHGSAGVKLSLNQIRRVFANTICAVDAPIRTFVAALVSYRLIFGDTPERLEPIFEIPGFLRDFAKFQRSSFEDSSGQMHRPTSLREDPRIREFHDARVTREGFHSCAFHVHPEGQKCSSAGNYKSEHAESEEKTK